MKTALTLESLDRRALELYVTARVAVGLAWHRLVKDEDGEGVISTAIATAR